MQRFVHFLVVIIIRVCFITFLKLRWSAGNMDTDNILVQYILYNQYILTITNMTPTRISRSCPK